MLVAMSGVECGYFSSSVREKVLLVCQPAVT